MAKIRVEELAAQMGVGSKEVLFLLQSIGVDVKSPQAALDESTVLAILQGKTHAPKQLIVRDTESKAFRPQKSALSRIKIVDKPPAPKTPPPPEDEAEPAPAPAATRAAAAEAKPAGTPAPAPAEPARPAAEVKAPKPVEPARTAVVSSEPEPEAPKPLPRKIILPPRPVIPPRPSAHVQGPGGHMAPRPGGGLPPPRTGAAARATGFVRPGPSAPSVYRPAPGGPGARPIGGPPRPGMPGRPGGPM